MLTMARPQTTKDDLERGVKLREARERKGLSVAAVAEAIGVKSRTTVYNWEKEGVRPELRVRPILTEILDLPEDFWFDPVGAVESQLSVQIQELENRLSERFLALEEELRNRGSSD